jgi:eukaryotic-like serine/threonine-protein kinase
MTGRVIGERYRILGAIGSGGMGTIYEALDLRTGVTVALKALQSGVHDTERLKRLRREAEIACTVRSRHICTVHYLGVEQGTPFIVMERLQGETVRERIARTGPLPVDEAVGITCQLLDALTTIHDAGFIHRDVKPSNVFLTSSSDETPFLKLIDFGLAMLAPSPQGSDANKESTSEGVAGTLHYLAPEQLVSLGTLDSRVDVYAAGALLFEMLTGRRVFEGGYPEVVHDILLGDLPNVTHHRPELPALFDDVLVMAMAKGRERRFASARAFKRALLVVLDQAQEHRVGVPTSGICPALDRSQSASVDEHSEPTRVARELPTLRPPTFSKPSSSAEPSSAEPYDLDDDDEGLKPTLRPPPRFVLGD